MKAALSGLSFIISIRERSCMTVSLSDTCTEK